MPRVFLSLSLFVVVVVVVVVKQSTPFTTPSRRPLKFCLSASKQKERRIKICYSKKKDLLLHAPVLIIPPPMHFNQFSRRAPPFFFPLHEYYQHAGECCRIWNRTSTHHRMDTRLLDELRHRMVEERTIEKTLVSESARFNSSFQ